MAWDKKRRMEILARKLKEKEVDRSILPVIRKINSSPDYFTTSSCAGRIAVIQMPGLGDKKNAEFLGKWHRRVKTGEVLSACLKSKPNKNVYLLSQSPIIHVRCRDLRSAIFLRNKAVESGLKYSTLKSLTLNKKNEPVKIVVEVLSSENIHAPIAAGGRLYPDREYLVFLVESANAALKRAQAKLARFKKSLD